MRDVGQQTAVALVIDQLTDDFGFYPVIVGEKRDVDFFRGTVLPIDSENIADNIRKRTAVLIFAVIMVEIDGGRKIEACPYLRPFL